MANPNKTKAEILQELESIKGLLLEEDDIPILQTIDEAYHNQWPDEHTNHFQPSSAPAAIHTNPSALSGQTSLFEDESTPPLTKSPAHSDTHKHPPTNTTADAMAHPGNHQPPSNHQLLPNNHTNTPRPLAKASGENPFLPQHIRERLHGNNPPPLFEYETAKKILTATKNITNKINKPRQILVDEVVNSLMPQIEAELRHRLFAMSVEDLEKLLSEDDE